MLCQTQPDLRGSGEGGDHADPETARRQACPGIARRPVVAPGVAVARAIVAERIDTIAGAIDGHAVWQRRNGTEEMGS